jgi:transcription elongation GreA/GreB family factor
LAAIGRRCYKAPAICAQSPGHQPRVANLCEAHYGVEALLNHIDDPIAEIEIQCYLGIGAHEGDKSRHHQHADQWQADTQCAALETARRDYSEAQAAGDREALARAGRDLRYWDARRASAHVVATVTGKGAVQFGNSVTIVRDDGREQTFRIVGEDEADPAKGSISHVSPLARALIGKAVGDSVRAGTGDAEIVAIG